MTVTSAVWWMLGMSLAATGLSLPSRAEPPAKEEAGARPAPAMSADEIKPLPLAPIPDDPPPHEGAMIGLPYIIEPPDLLLIEVLEALPGRPISGERLVRPDGCVNLGFYGDVYVRGLTLPQAKAKIALHLRKFLNDDTLGLEVPIFEEPAEMPPQPDAGQGPSDRGGPATKSSSLTRPAPEAPGNARIRRSSGRPIGERTNARPHLGATPRSLAPRRVSSQAQAEQPASEQIRRVEVPAGKGVNITIVIQGGEGRTAMPEPGEPMPPSPDLDLKVKEIQRVAPADTARVFLDVTAFNSKTYFILGDVAYPGRLPWTGQETVLDALNYAGGFLPTAEPKDVKLARPARAGKPAKVYRIDYEAITQRGDATANLQLFPGDRLIVGRNEVVKKTIEIDRLAAPYQTIVNSLLQYSFMARSVGSIQAPLFTGGAASPSPAQVQALIREWIAPWEKFVNQPGGAVLDAKSFRELLERNLNPPGAAPKDEKK